MKNPSPQIRILVKSCMYLVFNEWNWFQQFSKYKYRHGIEKKISWNTSSRWIWLHAFVLRLCCSLTTYHPCYLFITTGVCCLDARKEKKTYCNLNWKCKLDLKMVVKWSHFILFFTKQWTCHQNSLRIIVNWFLTT